MHKSEWELFLSAPSPSFAALARDPVALTPSLPTPNPSQATVNNFLASVNLDNLVTSVPPGHIKPQPLAAAASPSSTSALLMSAMSAIHKLPPLSKGMVGLHNPINLLPVVGLPEAPSPFDNIFDEHAVPTGAVAAASAASGPFGMGPTSRAAAATAAQLIVPEQSTAPAPRAAPHAAAAAAGRGGMVGMVAAPPSAMHHHTMEVDFSGFGVPTSPTPEQRYTSSVSPSPSPTPPPPDNDDYDYSYSGVQGRLGPVRLGRPRRAAAAASAAAAHHHRHASSPLTLHIPSASDPNDVAAALAELVALGLNVNAAPNKVYLMTAMERHEVKMMSQLAWKLFFKPELKAMLSAAEIKQVKKDRRRAKGTIYAQNSRRKQASEKNRTSDRIGELELENANLKAEVARLSAQLRR